MVPIYSENVRDRNLLLLLREFDAARLLFERPRTTLTDKLGDQHPVVSQSEVSLATSMVELGRVDEAVGTIELPGA